MIHERGGLDRSHHQHKGRASFHHRGGQEGGKGLLSQCRARRGESLGHHDQLRRGGPSEMIARLTRRSHIKEMS